MFDVALPSVMQGIQLVQVESQAVLPGVNAGDLLRINFNNNCISVDGFYAIKRRANDWSGVRRFEIGLKGLKMLDCDQWKSMEPSDFDGIEVIGHVEKIYKSMGDIAHGN